MITSVTRMLTVAAVILIFNFPVSAQLIWGEVNGPNGGEVYAFAQNGTTLFAGTYAGLYYSENGGMLWQKRHALSQCVYDIQIHSSGTIFAGTADYVWRSTDNGVTWERIAAGMLHANVRGVLIHGNDVYAGTLGGGVYKTSVSGSSWSKVSTGIVSEYVWGLGVSAQGTIIAATSMGISRSTNNGGSWTTAAGPFQTPVYFINKLNDTTLLAGQGFDILRSYDDGQNFTKIGGVFGTIQKLAIHQNGTFYLAGWNGLYTSTDNGITFQEMTSGLPMKKAYTVFAAADGTVFAGLQCGVFAATPVAAVWHERNSGLNSEYVTCLNKDAQNNIYAGTMYSGLFRAAQPFGTWERILTTEQVHSLLILNDTVMFASSALDGLYRTTDNGTSWTQMMSSFYFKSALGLCLTDSGHMMMGTYVVGSFIGGGIYRTSDYGNTWSFVGGGALTGNQHRAALNAGNGIILFGSNQGIHRSTDHGWNFTLSNTGLVNMKIIFLRKGSDGTIFAGTEGGLFRSSDQGQSWSRTFVAVVGINDMVFEPSGSMIISTAASTIFRSDDNGFSWNLMLFPSFPYQPTALLPMEIPVGGTNELLIGTKGNSVYSSNLPVGIQDQETAPAEFTLSGNYPNPFNPETKIQFGLPEPAEVTIEFCDITGSVLTNHKGVYQAGSHFYTWNGSNLASGVYLYRVNMRSLKNGAVHTFSRKMVLVR